MTLTATRLKELIHYNPETGVVTWIGPYTSGPRRTVAKNLQLQIDGTFYSTVRLIVLYMTGEYPPRQQVVFRIDGDTNNCRWANLKVVRRLGFKAHRRIKNETPQVGVFPMGNGRYVASILSKGKRKFIGTFPTEEEAETAISSSRLSV